MAQWTWVRRRVIECYKRAGESGQAVTIYRQAIKADPDDLDLRLDLVEALLANEQDQAASNELVRILQLDPDHIEANLRLARLDSEYGAYYAAEQRLRALLERRPGQDEARRELVEMLLKHGLDHLTNGWHVRAAGAFEEGQRLAPDDYRFPLNLARVAVGQRQLKRAGELLERTLELGAEKPDAYVDAIDVWAVADKIKEARAVLARAEAALAPTPAFYLRLGLALVRRGTPPALGGLLGAAPTAPADTVWSRLGAELLERAVALRPDDVILRDQIARELSLVRPELALPHAEAAVRLAPDDPRPLGTLGLVQGLTDRVAAGRETLRRAARLARQQGDPATAQHLDQLRQIIGSPMLRLALQMRPLLDDLDLEDDFFP